MKKIYGLFVVAGLLVASCSGEAKKEEKKKSEKKEEVAESNTCSYSVDTGSFDVGFTAYKFENKTGVEGKFQAIKYSDFVASEDPLTLVENIEFWIPVESLYTGNPDRDKKIRDSFFGTLANTSEISGKVLSVEGEKVMLQIKMNEITFEVEANQSFDGERLTLKAEINMDNWNGQDAIAALNKVCEVNHADAEGGKSVLWPNVSLNISAKIDKEGCK